MIKKSVRNEAITCLACGMHLKTLKRHVMASHGQTLADLQGALVAASGLPDHGSRLRGNALGTGTKAGLGRKPRTAGKTLEARAAKNGHSPKQTKEAAPQLKKQTRGGGGVGRKVDVLTM